MKQIVYIIVFLLSYGECTAQFPGIDLLRGRMKVEVPFEYIQGFIVVDILFNEFLPLKFIFDTGAENTLLLKKEISDLLGLNYSKKISLIGSDMSSTVFAFISRNVKFKMENSGIFYQDILVLEDDLNNLDEITGMNIDGILGANLFKNLALEIDYRRSRLVFYHPEYFETPGNEYTAFDIEVRRNKPYMTCKMALGNGKVIDVNLLIDTGASLNFLLHENTHPDIELPQYIIPGKIGTGIGGNLTGYLGKVGYLEFGEYKFERITTSFQNLDESVLESYEYIRNGILGNRLMHRFTVIIDYPEQKIYLKPRRWYINKPFKYDKSGLIIYAIGRDFDKYYIKEVIEGTPGDKVGIEPGDYIVKFNWFNTKFLTLEGITNALSKKPGKRIRMTVLRDGIKLKKEFYLEDFLEKNIQTLDN